MWLVVTRFRHWTQYSSDRISKFYYNVISIINTSDDYPVLAWFFLKFSKYFQKNQNTKKNLCLSALKILDNWKYK